MTTRYNRILNAWNDPTYTLYAKKHAFDSDLSWERIERAWAITWLDSACPREVYVLGNFDPDTLESQEIRFAFDDLMTVRTMRGFDPTVVEE